MDSSAERRQRRRKLKKLAVKTMKDILAHDPPDYPRCEYPTCEAPKVSDDCCYQHSIDGNVGGDAFLPNDGIIDWQAIDVLRQGLRPVKVTWVEYEIAGAHILADGLSTYEMVERTGISCRRIGPRYDRMKELADVFRAAA